MRSGDRPDIIFIFSDQQHAGAFGQRDAFFNTPAMDSIAAEAVVFNRSYCTTPQCSPSRSSLMTGLYPSRTAIWGNCEPGRPQLQMHTIAKALSEAGYKNAYFGKWHLGSQPIAREGFESFETCDGHQREIRQSGRHPDDLAIESAVNWLDKCAAESDSDDAPVALFVSLIEPHDIYKDCRTYENADAPQTQLPDSWHKENLSDKPAVQSEFMREDQGSVMTDCDESQWLRYHQSYRSHVENFDRCLDRLVDKLRQLDMYDSSMMVVTSDHGDMDTAHQLVFKGPFMYRNMLEVPLMIRMPRGDKWLQSGESDFMTVNVDLPTTLLDIAGADFSETQGLSLTGLLRGEVPPERPFIVAEYYRKQYWVNPIRTIMDERFKYNLYLEGPQELYDLQNDPHELKNLADNAEFQSDKDRLAEQLQNWMLETDDPFYSQQVTDRHGEVITP